jgi:hypothetical protein
MIPVRNVGEFTREGEKITLLIPKFKSRWMQKWLIPPRRSMHFRVHLDEMGSRVWDLIDGTRDTNEICLIVKETPSQGPESQKPTEVRVTEFLRQLYKNRFILFR